MKKLLVLILSLSLCVLPLTGCSDSSSAYPNGEVKIYNWGEYIDEDTIARFEEETGIRVVYDTFETNEDLYPIIAANAISYDAICPSDYMIEKMIAADLLQEIDFANVPNVSYIDSTVMEASKSFDPNNTYSVPYTYGTLGILYNTTLVSEPIDSWEDLWNSAYSNEILMYNSVRDLFVAPLRRLGYSINTTDTAQLEEAKQLLIEQKPLVQKYVMDQIKDTMASDSAAVAMCYSGEVAALQEQNENLVYVVPSEGSNFFIDSWVIPANAENKANAEAWINFLNEPEIAYQNFEYITYCTPNTGAVALMDESYLSNPAIFPDEETLQRCEVFHYLGDEGDAQLNELWLEIKDSAQ